MSRIPLGQKHGLRIYGDLKTLINVSWYTWIEMAHNNLAIKFVFLMIVLEFNFDLGVTKEYKAEEARLAEWRASEEYRRAMLERPT